MPLNEKPINIYNKAVAMAKAIDRQGILFTHVFLDNISDFFQGVITGIMAIFVIEAMIQIQYTDGQPGVLFQGGSARRPVPFQC